MKKTIETTKAKNLVYPTNKPLSKAELENVLKKSGRGHLSIRSGWNERLRTMAAIERRQVVLSVITLLVLLRSLK